MVVMDETVFRKNMMQNLYEIAGKRVIDCCEIDFNLKQNKNCLPMTKFESNMNPSDI